VGYYPKVCDKCQGTCICNVDRTTKTADECPECKGQGKVNAEWDLKDGPVPFKIFIGKSDTHGIAPDFQIRKLDGTVVTYEDFFGSTKHAVRPSAQ
jgi:hypothetical protein